MVASGDGNTADIVVGDEILILLSKTIFSSSFSEI